MSYFLLLVVGFIALNFFFMLETISFSILFLISFFLISIIELLFGVALIVLRCTPYLNLGILFTLTRLALSLIVISPISDSSFLDFFLGVASVFFLDGLTYVYPLFLTYLTAS